MTTTTTDSKVNPFISGKYYVFSKDDGFSGPYATFAAAADECWDEEEDIVLAALSPTALKIKQEKKTPVDVVIDFDKKVLTVQGRDVTINKVNYLQGDNELEVEDLTEWEAMIDSAYTVCRTVTVIGMPPIDGKEITNEMSDL